MLTNLKDLLFVKIFSVAIECRVLLMITKSKLDLVSVE